MIVERDLICLRAFFPGLSQPLYRNVPRGEPNSNG